MSLAGRHLSEQDGVTEVIGISPLSREIVLFLFAPFFPGDTLPELFFFLLVRLDSLPLTVFSLYLSFSSRPSW